MVIKKGFLLAYFENFTLSPQPFQSLDVFIIMFRVSLAENANKTGKLLIIDTQV